MRLIDIDELKKNIDEKIGDFPHRKMLFNVIDNQPTAYDIDKIVERLAKRASQSCAVLFAAGIEEAISIIKAGEQE